MKKTSSTISINLFVFLLLVWSIQGHFQERGKCEIHREPSLQSISPQQAGRTLQINDPHPLRIQGVFQPSSDPALNLPVLQRIFDISARYFNSILKVTGITQTNARYTDPFGCGFEPGLPPIQYRTIGFNPNSTDMIIFVFFFSNSSDSTIAFATYCQLVQWPTYGLISFNIPKISTNLALTGQFHQTLETTIHQMMHIMGVSSNFFDTSLTQSLFFTSYGSSTRKLNSQVVQNVGGIFRIVSTNVKAYVQNYFGCADSNAGALLEDNGGSGSAGSHWQRKVYYDQLMTSTAWPSGSKITPLTLNLLKDSNFYYSVDVTLADTPQFGRNKGCGFALGTATPALPEYCTTENGVCEFYGQYGGFCSSADSFANGASYIFPYSNLLCNFPDGASSLVSGYAYSGTSRCFNNANLNSPKCYESKCLNNGAQIQVTVQGVNGICSTPGASITVNGNTFLCPSNFVNFCAGKGCTNWCSTNGFCVKGDCLFAFGCTTIDSQCNSCFGSLCTQCNNNLFPNSTQTSCVSCSIAIPSCLSCASTSTGTICLSCSIGLLSIDQKSCQSGCSIANCQTCGVSNGLTICQTCSLGFPSSNRQSCVVCSQAISNCAVCALQNNQTICNACDPTLFPSPNQLSCLTCAQSILNCIQCNLNGTLVNCQQCVNSQFLLIANQCSSCSSLINNCRTCILALVVNTCSSCNPGFYLNNNQCVDCQTLIPNCDVCVVVNITSGAGGCSSCLTGFALNQTSGACQLCSSFIQNCVNCLNSTICLSCNSQLFVNAANGTQCQPCNQIFTNCSQCAISNGQTICIGCSSGSVLVNGTCLLCSSSISGCLECILNSTGTIKCTNCGSLFPNVLQTNCVACGIAINSCTNCQVVNQATTCTSCANGTALNLGLCQPCSSFLTNCVSCSSTTVCTSCNGSLIVVNGACVPCGNGSTINQTSGACQLCSSFIQNCVNCLNSTICLSCNSQLFVNAANGTQCQPCNQIFTNCSQCAISNGQTICIGCSSGSVLVNGTCLLCSSSISGCLECILNSTGTIKCTNCGSLFPNVLQTNCVACGIAINSCTNCQVVNQATTCTSCANGTALLSSTSCVSCTSPCSKCSITVTNCTECIDTYALVNNQCLKCSFPCEKCIGQVYICTSCLIGVVSSKTRTCSPCAPQCLTCRYRSNYCLNCTKTQFNVTTSGSCPL